MTDNHFSPYSCCCALITNLKPRQHKAILFFCSIFYLNTIDYIFAVVIIYISYQVTANNAIFGVK